jgi:hypothetical protein
MEYGQIKTEITARHQDANGDYYHYETVTEWHPTAKSTGWTHQVFIVNEDNTRILDANQLTSIERDYLDWDGNVWALEGYNSRITAWEQHKTIVRYLLG